MSVSSDSLKTTRASNQLSTVSVRLCGHCVFTVKSCVCVCVLSDQRLDEQGVKNHSKMMVLKVSDAEWKQQLSEEEEKKKNQNESLQRTQKGFQILSERGTLSVSLSVSHTLSVCHQCVFASTVCVAVFVRRQ